MKPFDLADLRARLASNIRRASDRSLDASWRRAVVASMQEAVLIADSDGLVTEMNDAFTRLVGWSMDDGPLRPPYPWWPDPATRPEAFELRSKAQAAAGAGAPTAGRVRDPPPRRAHPLGLRPRQCRRGARTRTDGDPEDHPRRHARARGARAPAGGGAGGVGLRHRRAPRPAGRHRRRRPAHPLRRRLHRAGGRCGHDPDLHGLRPGRHRQPARAHRRPAGRDAAG